MDKTATSYQCDILIFGAGIAGLWLANTLKRAGYHVLVIEKDKIGAVQALASHGMIDGGLAKMPERWNACLGGWGEVDLTAVKILSDSQILWPTTEASPDLAALGAAGVVNADTEKMKPDDFPPPLNVRKKLKGSVYNMPEKVLDTRTLLQALSKNIKGRILKGEVQELLPDGQAAVSGLALRAQLIIFTAGAGNDSALSLLKVSQRYAAPRPLRQIMVRPMPDALFGHGIHEASAPRLTVTSHDDGAGAYVWYIGGRVAEEAAAMDEDAAIVFAKEELRNAFPDIDWGNKEWATCLDSRIEPCGASAQLPVGPFIHQRGRILLAWPAGLTFVPALSDHVFKWLSDKDIKPRAKSDPPPLPGADIGSYPWETATWKRL